MRKYKPVTSAVADYRANAYQKFASRSFGSRKRPTLQRKVAKLVQASKNNELKWFDTAITFNVDATAEIQPVTIGSLVVIPQDDAPNGRSGRKIVIKSLEFRAQLRNVSSSAAGPHAQYTHMYLIHDKQANGANPVVSSNAGIFQPTTIFTGLLMRNLQNADRFRILRKWRVDMSPGTAPTATADTIKCAFVEDYIKLNIPIMYDQSVTDGTLPSIRSNNLFLVCGSDGVADDTVTVNCVTRVRYSDD